MFGYLKLDTRCPKKLRKQYKLYYCYLCRELQLHYGPLSRLLLSYDVAFFALFCADDELLSEMEKNKQKKDGWQQIREFGGESAAFFVTCFEGIFW